nr:early activation antigen CD69-like isoform X1 [Zootoca vivipara]
MVKDLLEGETKMGEHANTCEQPVNGAEHVKFLPQQNGASYNSEHLERGEIPVDNNLPKKAKKKKYTFKDWTVYFLIVSLSISVIGNIYQGVRNGILMKRSPTDQFPSGYDPCPQGWVLSKPSPSNRDPSCVNLCLQGWVMHQGWCYYFSTAETTWNSSQSNCSSYGGSLTAIDTPSEMKFLHSEKKATDYWIGLRREEGQLWKWANGSDFDPWFLIGADGQCAYLNDGNVSSSWCTTKRHWICRRPSHQT